ncbi:MAG: hypothetical protein AB8G17_13825 [Gammaproteobacteria bacterium]
MKVTVECQGFAETNFIDAHARQQVREALSQFTPFVETVHLCLRDVGELQGPAEYTVIAEIVLKNMPRATVEGNGCDLSLTVRYAARRAQRAVERSVRRARNADASGARSGNAFAPLANSGWLPDG